jgi:RimJ/RimL family protein N-acetyltransferase
MFAIPLSSAGQLRPLEPWQAEEFLAHADRAREQAAPWISWISRAHDLDSARAALQSYADRQAADTGRLFGIWLEDTLVGGCMYPTFDALQSRCEIGVWTEPAGQGHGLVTAAVRHLLDHALIERGLHRAEWRNSPGNARSRAVAERLGMTYEGTLRHSFMNQGVLHDSEVRSMLREEWVKLRAQQTG